MRGGLRHPTCLPHLTVVQTFNSRMFSSGYRDFDPRKDYYQTLGVSETATEKEIKIAYYKQA